MQQGSLCDCVRPAVNQQRDIVFDGTMTWAPFVEQTIAMVRDHANCYRRGPGYYTDEQGRIVERCGGPQSLSANATGVFCCSRQPGVRL